MAAGHTVDGAVPERIKGMSHPDGWLISAGNDF